MWKAIGLILLLLSAAIWWLLFDSRVPSSADGVFDIDAYRALIVEDENLPTDIDLLIVGEGQFPAFATEAGAGLGKRLLYFTAFKISSPDMTTIIGGAADDLTLDEMAQGDVPTFWPDKYEALKAVYTDADQIYITHEHLDHVMAITRHDAPETFADKLKLTAPQVTALDQFAPPGRDLAPSLKNLKPVNLNGPTRIAPGLVAAPIPGHTKGSLIFFARRADGQEYLFVGDIVWNMSNIKTLKTRPRLLQYIVFDPPEDRKAILAQVRALHDLAKAEPALVIVPSHDGDYLDGLVSDGVLGDWD